MRYFHGWGPQTRRVVIGAFNSSWLKPRRNVIKGIVHILHGYMSQGRTQDFLKGEVL